MKISIKHSLIAAVAVMAFASCSDDAPIEVNNGRAIDFRTTIETRNEPITITNLDQICVTALLIDGKNEDGTDHFKSVYFGGGEKNGSLSELFSKFGTGDEIYYKSATNFYWPADKSFLQFYAFAPTVDDNGKALITGTTINESLQAINFEPEDIIEDQIDLVTAEAKQNRVGGEATGVTLPFEHQLSQIEVLAYADNAKYDFYVSGVRIGRIASRGTFKFSNKEWVLGSYKMAQDAWSYDFSDRTSYSYEVPYTAGKDIWDKLMPDSQNPKNLMPQVKKIKDGVEVIEYRNAFVIPQKLDPWNREVDFANNEDNGKADNKGSYLAIKLRVTEKGTDKVVYPDPWGGEYKWAAIPIKGTWKPGKKYTYILCLTKGAGFVDPTEPQPGTPILHDPIEFKVIITDFKGDPDPETPTDLEWDNGK